MKPPCHTKPRVLIVENEPEDRELLAELLTLWGYEPFVVEAKGLELILQAIQMVKEKRCQIALVDMRLRDNHDPNDKSGLELIQKLFPAGTIINSGFGGTQIGIAAVRQYGAEDFVEKLADAKILKQHLDDVADRLCACRRDLRIFPDDIHKEINSVLKREQLPVPEDEVADLFVRLYPEASRLEIEPMNRISPSSLSKVPRPRSKILYIQADDYQPELVKIARAEKMKKEIERYRKHIERRLQGRYYPQLRHSAVLWDLGGAVYTFMGTEKIVTLTTFYQDHEVKDIEFSLKHFFTHTWSPYYLNPVGHHKNVNIFKAYSDVWDWEWYTERVENFQPIFPHQVMPNPWDSLEVPEPSTWLKKHVASPDSLPTTTLAITHGDFHGDNALVDDTHHIWAIDFERTGLGPILQDFVELEMDIIDRLVGLEENDFKNYYALCVWAVQSTRLDSTPPARFEHSLNLVKAAQVIAVLRGLAFELTGEINTQNYIWGLLFNSLFRASLLQSSTPDLIHKQRILMFASILCHRLDHWDETWPPKEWP